MKTVLFSRPDHDDIIAYLHCYSKELVDLAKSKGLKTINKEKDQARKDIILSIIEKQKPDLIMFNGHGSPKCICGHKDEVIVSSDDNPDTLSNTITYALACCAASELGIKAYENGALCFIGYCDDFALGRDPNRETTPGKDRIAKLFLEPSNILFSCLIKRQTAKIAILRAKEKMEENIWFLNTTDEFPEAPHYAPFLYGNYTGLVSIGNEDASI